MRGVGSKVEAFVREGAHFTSPEARRGTENWFLGPARGDLRTSKKTHPLKVHSIFQYHHAGDQVFAGGPLDEMTRIQPQHYLNFLIIL